MYYHYVTIPIIIVFVSTIFFKLNQTFTYWKNKRVKSPNLFTQIKFLLKVLFRRIPLGQAIKIYHTELPQEKVLGIYQFFTPVLITKDSEVIKKILIKNFNDFTDKTFNYKGELFTENVFIVGGDKWKALRQTLSPVFTTGRLKNMFYLLNKSANNMDKYINNLVKNGNDYEIRELAARYTLECVGSCVFGIDMDTFSEGENIYRTVAKNVLSVNFTVAFLIGVDKIFPSLLHNIIGSKPNKENRNFRFFYDMVDKVIQAREGKPKVHNDFMDLLIDMKEKGKLKVDKTDSTEDKYYEITDGIITAQAFSFFGAGFEPASAAISFLLHELALNPDIQARARNEVDDVVAKFNGEISYEAIKEMHYLEMLLLETLRKYPSAEMIFRKCVNDCELLDGLNIEKDTNIAISLMAVHHNPDFFPNPENFDPERFSAKNKANIPVGAFLPFGDGPRQCIGYRFAKMMSLVAVATILKSFKILRTELTIEKLTYESRSFAILVLVSKEGLWVRFEKREGK